MPNPEKWEGITFDEIKKGDEIRCIITDEGGYRTDTRGFANEYKAGYPGPRWVHGSGWVAARKEGTGTSKSTFYRKKPPPFVFPQKSLAVIEGYNRGVGSRVKLFKPVRSQRSRENVWLPVNPEGVSSRYTEEYIIGWSDLKVLHEGVDL